MELVQLPLVFAVRTFIVFVEASIHAPNLPHLPPHPRGAKGEEVTDAELDALESDLSDECLCDRVMGECCSCCKATDAITALRRELVEIRHTLWHALDDSETREDEVALTIEHADALGKLVPEEHPLYGGVTVGPAAPQPTLAERLRAAGYNEYVNPDEANELMEEAADAFDAADREHEENERLREMVKEAWRVGSELRAENEALRERYARLDAAVMLYLEAHDRPWLEPSWSVTVHERRRVLASVRKELAEEAPDAE